MPQYLSPRVYVEEVEAGSRPIEGVGTSVAAFVGLAQRGPFNQPTQCTNWSQFVQTFGDFMEGSYLAHSVYGYFFKLIVKKDGKEQEVYDNVTTKRGRRSVVTAVKTSKLIQIQEITGSTAM